MPFADLINIIVYVLIIVIGCMLFSDFIKTEIELKNISSQNDSEPEPEEDTAR